VPELVCEVEEVSVFDGWASVREPFLYVSVILLYAVSLEGSLAYNQQRFITHSRVFELVSPDVFKRILEQIFNAQFIEVYTDKLECGAKLNFYTCALFFAGLRSKKYNMHKSRIRNFINKNGNLNVGFHLSKSTEKQFRHALNSLRKTYFPDLISEAPNSQPLYRCIYDEIAGCICEGDKVTLA
jgi:hypothetical protein